MKTRIATLIGGGLALTMTVTTHPSSAQQAAPPPSNRVALVIGEGAYRSEASPASPNDAGLVAETLAGAGFDVTGARDLDGDGLRGAVRDFLAKAGTAGPDGIALVYFAGRALQFDGDSYFEPIDARLARPSDVPIETLRLGDLDRALAALPIQAKVVVVDGAYAGQPADLGLPSGLALVEAEQGELLAFNAAPGTVAPKGPGPYGIYAQSLVQAMKQGGAPVEDVFDRLRLSVETATGGAVVPWDSNKLTRSFKFFDRAADAPLVDSAQIPFSALQKRPLRNFPPDQAFDVAIARDTLPAYAEFLTAFPNSPMVRRVQLLQAVRRETLFWSLAVRGGTPPAFWTYLTRYAKGPHAVEARRRLSRLAAASLPPPSFAPLAFDVPPPPEAEVVVFERPIIFDGPDFPPPPRPPVFLLPPRGEPTPPPPPRPLGPGFLPIPVPFAIPSVRGFGEVGIITPPRTVRGAYPHPRPFVRGPNGEGLAVEQGTPPGDRPGNAPAQSQPVPAPHALPAAGQLPAAGAGQLAPAGQPGLASRPAPQPAPPASPATVTGRPAPVPALTTLPGANPLPTPAAPGRTSVPALRSGEPVPDVGRVKPRTPKPVTPDPLSAPPVPAQQPAARLPAAQPAASGQPVARPAARQGAGPAGDAKRPSGVAPLPVTAAPSPAPSKSLVVRGPPLAAAPQQRLAPEPRPAPVQRALPQPGAPRPAEGPQGEGGSGRRRPACGHPGEPPCHP